MTVYRKKARGIPLAAPNCFIAGGAVLSRTTGQEIVDVDLYPKDKSKLESILAYLIGEEDCRVIGVTSRAITLKSNLYTNSDGYRMLCQVMVFDEFPTADHIFNKFDFTVCMGAYDCDKEEFVYHHSFFEDVAARRINFNVDTEYPYASLVRVKKYSAKGFSLSKGEFMKIGMSVARKGLPSNWDELAESIGGVYGVALKLGDELPYTFDNAIEVLTNLQFPSMIETAQEEDTTLSELFKKMVGYEGLVDVFFNLKKCTYEFQMIEIANKYHVINGDTVHYEFKSSNSPTTYNNIDKFVRGIGNKEKVNDIGYWTLFGSVIDYAIKNFGFTLPDKVSKEFNVYVPVFEDEDFNQWVLGLYQLNTYSTELKLYTCVEGDNKQPASVFGFRNIGDAVAFVEKTKKDKPDLKLGNPKYVKAVFVSDNITYHTNNFEILTAKGWVNKGL